MVCSELAGLPRARCSGSHHPSHTPAARPVVAPVNGLAAAQLPLGSPQLISPGVGVGGKSWAPDSGWAAPPFQTQDLRGGGQGAPRPSETGPGQ